MTTIVAVRDGDRTWIGSDTLASHCGTKIYLESKWVRFGSWAFGVAGDMRTIDIGREHAEHLLDDVSGPFEFTQRFRTLLKEFEYDMKPAENEAVSNTAQDLILACPHGAWSIFCDLSFRPVEMWVEGSGRAFGLGALAVLEKLNDMKPRDMARIALETAIHYDKNSGGAIFLEALE